MFPPTESEPIKAPPCVPAAFRESEKRMDNSGPKIGALTILMILIVGAVSWFGWTQLTALQNEVTGLKMQLARKLVFRILSLSG